MKISKAIFYTFVPLAVFGVPLGLGNSFSQPLAMIALLPFVILASPGFRFAAPFLLFVFLTSLVRVAQADGEYSYYQFIRSGLPFSFLCLLICGYKQASTRIAELLDKLPNGAKLVDYAILALAVGQLIQALLFAVGIDLANAASKSEEAGRIMLFPTTGMILIFGYACYSRNLLLICISGVVLLASGSKAILLSALTVALISAWALKSFRKSSYLLVMAGLCMTLAAYMNPLAVERLHSFATNDQLEDATRAYEIAHAKESFLESTSTILIGNGLAVPLTPGVPTSDPRWFENSKYDIENGYWGLLAKLGVLGCIFFMSILLLLPKNFISLSIACIWMIFSYKTSYQYFATFDGCYLIIISYLISYLVSKNNCQRRFDPKNTAKFSCA